MSTLHSESRRRRVHSAGERVVLGGSTHHPSPAALPAAGYDPRLGVGIHETAFRVNVRWLTPLGEETASMS